MSALVDDLRFAFRMARKSPGLTAAAVATLALGIGANSAVFSIVNAVMLRPLPYPDPARLVVLWGTDTRPVGSLMQPIANRLPRNHTMVISTVPERWRRLSQSFEHIAWYSPWMFSLTTNGDPERVKSGLVSADFFAALNVAPALGRTFLPSEIVPGSDHVALLGNGLWRRRFAADPHVIGRQLTLDGVPHTILGVLPEGFQAVLPYMFNGDLDVWAPISREFEPARRWSVVTAIGRLRPGVAIAQAQAEMDAVSKRLEPEGRAFKGHGVNLVRLDREIASNVRPALLILLGAVACVLLIGCTNLAGIMLARTAARRGEIGIRTVLGAGRVRIVRQVLTECLLLAAAGGALGVLVSVWISRAIVLMRPAGVPRLDQVKPDLTLFLFGLAASLVAGLLFGLLPALQSTRATLSDLLKAAAPRLAPGARLLAPRSLLVVFEIGLALVLLIGAGLLLRSFALLKAVDPGFNVEHLLTLTVPLPPAIYRTPGQQSAFAAEMLERVRTIPSVTAATVSNSLPFSANFTMSVNVGIEGRELAANDNSVFLRAVTTGYLRAMGIPLLKGRDLTESDAAKSDTVLVNQAAARHFWPDADPIGSHIYIDKGKPRTIVGIVGNVKNFGLDAETASEIYVPFGEMPTVYLGLAVRTSGDPGAVTTAVRQAVTGIDRNQPVDYVATMRDVLADYVARPRFNLLLLGAFAALALVLAVVGIYGVVAYSVTERTHEIGVRMALGAETGAVLRVVVGQAAILGAAGIVLGLAGSFAATRVLKSFLFGIPPDDALTFTAVSVLLLAVCLAASYIPARRAAKVDPMVALRYE